MILYPTVLYYTHYTHFNSLNTCLYNDFLGKEEYICSHTFVITLSAPPLGGPHDSGHYGLNGGLLDLTCNCQVIFPIIQYCDLIKLIHIMSHIIILCY